MRIQWIAAGCLLSALASTACGQTDSGSPSSTGGSANVATGGAPANEAGASSGGAAAAGRAASGGAATATGGATASGGATATAGATASGGATATAGASSGGIPGAVPGPLFECLGPEIRACEVDSDCVFVRTYNCCGAGVIHGLGNKFRGQFPECYEDVLPPVNCPPLGCFSSASTEDGQDAAEDGVGVVARCYEIEPGRKECRTTIADSCVHQVTRCGEGDECSNGCDQPCVCQDGFMVCEKPEVGSACSRVQQACSYANSPTDGTANTCMCSNERTWGC